MKLHYIYHSCFVVEADAYLIVYDYWRDNGEGLLHRLIEERGDKRLYFVVSHFHEDHYNPEILGYGDARLLLSYDTVKRRRVPKLLPFISLRPGDEYEDEYLKLQALRSTDVGISTLTTLSDGTTLYHAGDNNNWYFLENEEEHIRCSLDEMEGLFISIVREMQKMSPEVDHVMFPVDPRLGNEMLRGAFQWLRHIRTAHFYPMHCWGRRDEVNRSLEQLRELFRETDFVEIGGE